MNGLPFRGDNKWHQTPTYKFHIHRVFELNTFLFSPQQNYAQERPLVLSFAVLQAQISLGFCSNHHHLLHHNHHYSDDHCHNLWLINSKKKSAEKQIIITIPIILSKHTQVKSKWKALYTLGSCKIWEDHCLILLKSPLWSHSCASVSRVLEILSDLFSKYRLASSRVSVKAAQVLDSNVSKEV